MFQKGNNYGSKSKRGKSKFNTELKEYLGDVSNNIIKEIDIKELSNYERIQFLRTILPYLMPKKKASSSDDMVEDQPIFIEIIDKTSDVDK